MAEREEEREHDKWLSILERVFNKNGFTTIREGKMFLESRGWKEPDLFVLRDDRLLLVLEVMASPSYRGGVLVKARRMRQRFSSMRIVFFEPVEYMDKKFLDDRKEHYKANYLGHYPSSFKEVEDFCIEEWLKEKIKIEFWNENNYQDNITSLAR